MVFRLCHEAQVQAPLFTDFVSLPLKTLPQAACGIYARVCLPGYPLPSPSYVREHKPLADISN